MTAYFVFRWTILLSMVIVGVCLPSLGRSEEMFLRDNLDRAVPGDFIVTSQNKTYTLLHIYDKTAEKLQIEEITVPERKISLSQISWDSWVESGAPGHTSWLIYDIDLSSGQLKNCYSLSKNSWYDIPEADSFLSILLNLRFYRIEEYERKRIGPSSMIPSRDSRPLWQPVMIVNGRAIKGVAFDAWRTHWPKDGSELSGKTIEIYLPQDSDHYPSYFPYWLQISGVIGKAKVRIVDSGTGLFSSQY